MAEIIDFNRSSAAAPVLTPATSTSPEIDPVFALIDAHRKACNAHVAAMQLQNRIEKTRGSFAANWVAEKPCRDENEAFAGLVFSVATTLPGLEAKLAYLRELAEDDEWGWVFDEREGTALGLIESFCGSIGNVLPQVQP
jgi:hypothetical protein